MGPVERLIDVHAIGAQLPEQRFTKEQLLQDDLPQVATWRCNLTGLSQKCNLYFAAYGKEIFVYAPSYPAQQLGEIVLIIPYLPTAPDLQGYIDPYDPGCINNLVITDLGSEEIIATVRDNGDVHAVLVRHVVQAIQARVGTALCIVAHGLRPFFQGNVGKSAWGLAIHTQARVIAVSSNRAEVTIFRFGLTTDRSRSSDVTTSIRNGNANTPCIAFCNTGDDTEARWLLTADINGEYAIMDLRDNCIIQQFSFTPATQPRSYTFDRINAGWFVSFLDSRSFSKQDSKHTATGLRDRRSEQQAWDISQSLDDLHDLSSSFFQHKTLPSMLEQSTLVQSPMSTSGDDSDIDLDIYEEVSVVENEDYESSEENSLPPPKAANLQSRYPRFSKHKLCGELQCPILCMSVRDIYLLQPQSTTPSPFVGFTHPLRQSIQAQFYGLDNFERLNMCAYMPQLGVYVVASQKGRVVVLALTKVSSDHGRSTFALKAEAILPFASQERAGLRPFMPLLGIAAGPLQGSLERWRLMLTFYDHTVLTYELRRRADELVVI